MKLTILAVDGIVGIDGAFYPTPLSGLDPAIHAVHFDGGIGHVEFKRTATVWQTVRDIAAEDAAWAKARAAEVPEEKIDVPVMMKKIRVHRENEPLTAIGPFAVFIERWRSVKAESEVEAADQASEFAVAQRASAEAARARIEEQIQKNMIRLPE